jgi:NADP-dependent 3-hydroxy acid dehydrogenase YdfG
MCSDAPHACHTRNSLYTQNTRAHTPQARAAGVPLRVSGISPGLVETEFFSVRAFGDAAAAKKVTSAIECLQPGDVASAVLWVLGAPAHMEVNDVVIRPTQQVI